MHFSTLSGQFGERERLIHAHHSIDFTNSNVSRGTLRCNFEVCRGRHRYNRCNVVLLLSKLNEVDVFVLLDVRIVYHNYLCSFADFCTELIVVLLLDLYE